LREALPSWLDQHEQLAGLLDPQGLQQQFQAAYDSLRPSPEGVPIPRLRRLLQWPRERFDAVLEALRATQSIDLDALPEPAGDTQAIHDSYHVRIPVIPATQSDAKLPPNPKEACHPIRTKAAPHRSPIGAQRRLG
jgi:hypothetical protein